MTDHTLGDANVNIEHNMQEFVLFGIPVTAITTPRVSTQRFPKEFTPRPMFTINDEKEQDENMYTKKHIDDSQDWKECTGELREQLKRRDFEICLNALVSVINELEDIAIDTPGMISPFDNINAPTFTWRMPDGYKSYTATTDPNDDDHWTVLKTDKLCNDRDN
jgi:hypothetical protein